MDKNTITGLVLIAILLVGFSIFSRPSKEQLEAQQRYYDSIALVQQRDAELQAKKEAALANERETALNDSTSLFFQSRQGADSLVSIQNNLATLTLNAEAMYPSRSSTPLTGNLCVSTAWKKTLYSAGNAGNGYGGRTTPEPIIPRSARTAMMSATLPAATAGP